MHILLLYQYYHNLDCAAAGRHHRFINFLSKHHDVTLFTSDIWEHKRQTHLFDWVPEGTTLHSFSVPYDNAMSVADRFKAYTGFALNAMKKGIFAKKPDIIIGSSTPLTAAWAAACIARFHRIPWVFEVRDLWPDFPIQMGAVRSPWIQKLLYRLERKLYESAAHIITLSPDMERHVRDRDIPETKVTTLLNGTDPAMAERVTAHEVEQLRKKHGFDGKNVVLYAGTFGRANAIPELIEAARRLSHRSDIHFVFLGEGYFEPELQKAASELGNLSVFPAEPRHRIFRWFRMARLSLVSFIDIPVLSANSPAKFFDSLAAGTPVIVTNPGWTRAFVDTYCCGWYAPIEEHESLVRCIEGVLQSPEAIERARWNGIKAARAFFDRTRMAETLEHVLIQCVSAPPRQPTTLH